MIVPSFLGIGAPRCGTTWLFHNLKLHPEVWLPPIKEVHYWDTRNLPVLKNTFHLRRVKSRIGKQILGILPGRATEIHDIGWDINFTLRKNNFTWYRSLFRPGVDQISGEITPAYSTLSEETVKEIFHMNPSIKIIYLLRDPIDRAWSAVVKTLGRNKKRSINDVPREDIYKYFESAAFKDRGGFIRTINSWQKIILKTQFFIGYLNEIINIPEVMLQKVYAFLNISEDPSYITELAHVKINTSATPLIPIEFERYLANYYYEQQKYLKNEFGGYFNNWYQRCEKIVTT